MIVCQSEVVDKEGDFTNNNKKTMVLFCILPLLSYPRTERNGTQQCDRGGGIIKRTTEGARRSRRTGRGLCSQN